MSHRTKILLFAIIALAAILRFAALDRIPPGVYPDEAIKGVEGLEAVKTGDFKIFYPSNNGREGLWVNMIGVAEKAFGVNQFSLHFWAALLGTLTVLGIFFLTRELFISRDNANQQSSSPLQNTNRTNYEKERLAYNPVFRISYFSYFVKSEDRIALLAAFFLATSFWHINFSRIAFRAIMVPFLMVWSFYFLLKTLHTKENPSTRFTRSGNFIKNFLYAKRYTLYAILGGALFGLGFHTYIAFRFAPFVLLALLALEYFKTKKTPITYKLKAISFFLAAALLTALPMGLFFLRNPQYFWGRAASVSIFATASPIKTLLGVLGKTLLMFNFHGDCNWRHNMGWSPSTWMPGGYCSPQLLLPVGIFFLIGLGKALRSLVATNNQQPTTNTANPETYNLKPETWFLLSWLAFLLLPELLTWDGIPHALRSIGILPPVMILAALGANYVLEKFSNKKFIPIIVIAIVIVSGTIEPYRYFAVWAKNSNAAYAFARPYVEIGRYLNSLATSTPRYVIVNAPGVLVPHANPDGTQKDIPMPAQTVIYETLTHTPATYLLPEDVPAFSFPKGSVIAPLEKDDPLFENLRLRGYDVAVMQFRWFSVGIIE